MDIQTKQAGEIVVVSVAGSIDALTSPRLAEFLSEQIGAGHTRLVADLAGVEFMSSAGLRAILAALKESRQGGGDLRIAGALPNVQKVLKMSGFTTILKTYTSTDDALASFDS